MSIQQKYIRINPKQPIQQMVGDLDKNLQIMWQAGIDNRAKIEELIKKNNSNRSAAEMEQTVELNHANAEIFSLMVGNCAT